MRNIKYIAVHCTAGHQTQTIASLRGEFRQRGWVNPGYHYVIDVSGKVTQLLPDDKVSNGVRGYNSVTVNVAYMGGIDDRGRPVDNRTEAQKHSLRSLLKLLHGRYPNACIQGHRDFSPDLNRDGRISRDEWIKACPCFDAKMEYSDL